MTDHCPIRRGAVFSRCRRYRYALWREWDAGEGTVMFIGLNPSTADHRRDDPTIRRCIGFARDWGFRRLYIGNIFAYRTPYPRVLKQASEPVGRGTNRWLRRMASDSALVVAAWGHHGAHRDRAAAVLLLLDELHCLGRTKDGAPRHPLYLRRDAAIMPLTR